MAFISIAIAAAFRGLGLESKFLEVVLGKKVTCDVKKGTPLSWDMIK